MARGKFITILGINNLGKSAQSRILIENLQHYGLKAEYLKYPIYDLEPTGPKINEVLRSGKAQEILEIEFQNLYAQNRKDYQHTLEGKLNKGINIVAEDYIGTGLAWGIAKGADKKTLLKQNEGLIVGDIAIVLDGNRFTEAKEKNHVHEQNDELTEKCRRVHLDLAKEYNWPVIKANQSMENVSQDIWQIIEPLIDDTE